MVAWCSDWGLRCSTTGLQRPCGQQLGRERWTSSTPSTTCLRIHRIHYHSWLRRESLLLHIKEEPAEVVRASVSDVAWMPPSRGVLGLSHQEEILWNTWDLEELCLSAGLGTPWCRWRGFTRRSDWGQGNLGVSAEAVALATDPFSPPGLGHTPADNHPIAHMLWVPLIAASGHIIPSHTHAKCQIVSLPSKIFPVLFLGLIPVSLPDLRPAHCSHWTWPVTPSLTTSACLACSLPVRQLACLLR